MLIDYRRQQAGLSLIEVLVSIVISIVIVIAVISVFSDTVTSSQKMISSGRLNKALDSIMNTMVADIQRAGSCYNPNGNATNPCFSGTDDLTTIPTCVTFTYDTGDGTVSDADRYGYRLNGTAMQYRSNGASVCASTSGWTDFSDPKNIVITGFSVSQQTTSIPVGTSTSVSQYRTVTLTLTGRLTNDTNTVTLSRTIKIYNNKYVP